MGPGGQGLSERAKQERGDAAAGAGRPSGRAEEMGRRVGAGPGREGSGEVWAAGESGPGRRQRELGRPSWAAGGWGLGRVSSWVGFSSFGFSLPFYFYFLHY